MSRFDPPAPSAYSPEQTAVADAITSGPRGGVRGPLARWLHRPDLASKAQDLGAYCRYGSSLPPRLSELAILITAVHWQADFEWAAHEGPARAAGLDDAFLDSLRAGHRPGSMTPEDEAVWNVATELLQRRRVSDDTYATAMQVLGQGRLVDLVGVLGYYALISMTLTTFEIAADQRVFAPSEGGPSNRP